ncbi:malonate decarboxylase holo-ACP synthase [Halobacillus sp. Marseille-Q1614]|uniref:malonate decarboxylase holo-ACP synthase n=1 Tax=Halobacillus sp. Marseille-Q1614 TaxID=2709134 RepID=UPI00156E26AF|nr:malonate decarboxylase holo-ACP synthase [Halobacillus sp. Marseille-Q1614]
MVINPHDLLEIKRNTEFLLCSPVPDWVNTSLHETPVVVVRRAPRIDGKIPVGVRGKERSERFGAYIDSSDILKHFSPPTILQMKEWKNKAQNHPMPAVQALDLVDEIVGKFKLLWGPGGSVGFELVSGNPTVKETSDLDIIIFSKEPFSVDTAIELLSRFNQLPVTVDVQVEIPTGSISLAEYARGNFPILLKTNKGARLVDKPWGLRKESTLNSNFVMK